MMKKIILLLVAFAIVLSGCSFIKRKYTDEAWGRDYIWGVEIQKNGSYRVWMRYDDTSSYCTGNKTLGEQALRLLNREEPPEVLFSYVDPEIQDDDAGKWYDTTLCGPGIYESKQWILLDIYPVSGQ